MEQIKLKVVYEPYARFAKTPVTVGHITAESFREAIIKMLGKVRMYTDEESIMEQEEDLGRKMTQDELLQLISEQNGDGCDYILSITNEDTDEVYLEEAPYFEEWHI